MKVGPVRSCTGCRTRRSQGELVRVARAADGTFSVDRPGEVRGQGRGAYVCPEPHCVERALGGGALGRTLRYKGALPPEVVAALRRSVGRA